MPEHLYPLSNYERRIEFRTQVANLKFTASEQTRRFPEDSHEPLVAGALLLPKLARCAPQPHGDYRPCQVLQKPTFELFNICGSV